MKDKIYSTVGVYGNGVTIKNLPDHIGYNLTHRPGRAFFVNGVCVWHRFLKIDEVLKWEKRITEDRETFWREEDTQPYV